jgi:type II secretory pathway component PulM
MSQRITQSAAALGIDIRRLDPQGNAIAVSVDAVAFSTFLGWVKTLSLDHSMTVLSAEIGRLAEPGSVSVRVLLGEVS